MLALLLLSTSPSIEPRQLLLELKKAEALTQSEPHEALSIWDKHKIYLKEMPIEMQERWLTMAFRSSDGAQDLALSGEILKLTLPVLDQIDILSLLPRYYQFLGGWFHRQGYFEEARHAYLCAQTKETNEYNKLRYFSDMAIAERDLGNYQKSLDDFHQALLKAESLNKPKLAPIIEHNLGVTYLITQETEKAIVYFRKALRTFNKKNMKAFSIVTSTNMLLAFALEGDEQSYKELYFNIKKNFSPELINQFQTFLTIINLYHKVEILRESLSLEDKSQLVDAAGQYRYTGSSKMLIYPLKKMGIPISSVPTKEAYNGDFLRFFDYCAE
jgi:tetratricopeptide (TPR) repeat protein